MSRYGYYKPNYRPTNYTPETKTVRFSDSVDLDPKTDQRDSDRTIQSILADLEDVKTVLRKVCGICRTQQEWIRTFSRDAKDQRQDPLVQAHTSFDDELGLLSKQTIS